MSWHAVRAAVELDKTTFARTTTRDGHPRQRAFDVGASMTWHVLIVIAYHVNLESGVAFPTMETIANCSALSLSKVKRAVNELCALGLVERWRTSRRASYRYRLNLTRLAELKRRPRVRSE